MPATKTKKPRRKKERAYKSFKLAKKIKPVKALPGFLSLFSACLGLIRANKRLFFGIIAVNSILSLIFVAGISSSSQFVHTKQSVQDILGETGTGQATATVALFGYLIGAAGSQASEVAGTYQLFLNLITSLAIIWAVRQIMAGEKVNAKDAYYRGLYPLVPVLLVLFVIGLQLLPAAIGASLYSIVLSGGLAVTAIEKIVWLLIFSLLLVLSLYMITSSIFAIYIVTLPDMTPMKALRSARGLVMHRRLSIGLRIVALIFVLLLASLLITVPIIIFLPWLAIIIFLIYSSLALCIAHAYLYNLYRNLL